MSGEDTQPERACDECGASLAGRHALVRYCSDSCSRSARSARRRAARSAPHPDPEYAPGCRCDSPRPVEVEGGTAIICDSCGELLPDKLPPSDEGRRYLRVMARELVKLRAEMKAIRGHHDRGGEALAATLATAAEGQPAGGRNPNMYDFTPPLQDRAELDQVRNVEQRERVERTFKQAPPLRLALTRQEAAEAIGVSLTTFKTHVQPDLRIVRRGKCRMIPVAELERWVAENAEQALPKRGNA